MEREITLMVEPEAAGKRLDSYVSSQIEDLSRNYAEQLINEGRITVDNVIVAKKHKLRPGQQVNVIYPEPTKLDVTAQNIPLDIIYEDEDVIVVNKPRGMVVHPSAGNEDRTLVNAIMHYCGDSLSSINGTIRPGIVHRIDKDTSGLLMVAKNNVAHESLAAQLKVHSVTREYWALVYDNIREEELTIDAPIGRDERNRLRRWVNGSNPKNAVTHVRVLRRYGKYTLIAARLETGRTHQIRVHLSYIKHPLVGDVTYGPKKQLFGLEGQLLHAKTLGFIHPRTGEYMEFQSGLPDYFTEVLEKIEKQH